MAAAPAVAKPLTRTVAVLGGSYGGTRAAQALARGLPDSWRVVLIDRNSHSNHLYVIPRYAVVSGHEYKGFIPYHHLLRSSPNASAMASSSRHLVLHATVQSLTKDYIRLSRAFPEYGLAEPTIGYDYLVYALGSHAPDPIELWDSASLGNGGYDGTKVEGIAWLKRAQKRIAEAPSVLVVGGGALGIRADIAEAHPGKQVTLLHSRDRLLPKFDPTMHDEIISELNDLGVRVILEERLDLSSLTTITAPNRGQERTVRTVSGKTISTGLLLLCTGQRPNTAILAQAFPETVIGDGPQRGLVRVTRTMQIAAPFKGVNGSPDGLQVVNPNIFAIGDAADAFGAVKAGHTAAMQGYTGPPGIKVSTGLSRAVYQMHGHIGKKDSQPLDLEAAFMWKRYGFPDDLQDADMID